VKIRYRSLPHALLSALKHLLLPLRLRFALRDRPSPVLVEVGANDGLAGDPLYRLIRNSRHGLALLIEPVPYLFDRLRITYSGLPNCILANVAIAPAAGTMPIYYIDPRAKERSPKLPRYFEELASFDKERIENALGGSAASLLCERLVRTTPLTTLLAEHRITHVDLLQVDTEGYDYEVLKTFPFEKMKPLLVCFEHCHLCDSDRKSAISLLVDHGYKIEKWGKDFVCRRVGS
jgi:FkbM family methyltransferase